jgi:alkylation response protein AidB-like acyl-CoA dehydrogenase
MTVPTATTLEAIEETARTRIAAHARGTDRDGAFPEVPVRALARVGALGLLVPVEHGGTGAGLAALAAACEAVGRACASTGMVFLMHAVASAAIARRGGDDDDELPARLAGGEALATLALGEEAGVPRPRVLAYGGGGALRIRGGIRRVTSGGEADVMLVLVEGDGGGLDLFAVERAAPGVSFRGTWDGPGLRGSSRIDVVFRDTPVRAAARACAPGGAGALLAGVVAPALRAGSAAVHVGIAQAAVDCVRADVDPHADGALTDLELRTRAARAALRAAAEEADARAEPALLSLDEARAFALDTAALVTQRALDACACADAPGAPVARHARDARTARSVAMAGPPPCGTGPGAAPPVLG